MGGGMFVYVSNAGSREIIVLRLDAATGVCTPVQKIAVSGKVMPMAVSPDRRFLYAALRSAPYAVASFAIDPLRGTLTHLADTPVPDSLVYISTDRTGRFLLGALNPTTDKTRRSGLICVSPIGQHGFVQPVHQVIRTEPKTHAILPDPTNRYVFASSCDGDVLLRQAFDAHTGKFTAQVLAPVRVIRKSGPRHFVFHPNNRYFYLLNEYDASIYAFAYDVSDGSFSELQMVSALSPDCADTGKPWRAADLHLTPDGRFLYASERTSSKIAAFKVDPANGMLAPAGHFATELEPRSFSIDPYGRYLLAAGVLSHSMTSYAINSDTGRLTEIKRHPMGQGPNWIEIVNLP